MTFIPLVVIYGTVSPSGWLGPTTSVSMASIRKPACSSCKTVWKTYKKYNYIYIYWVLIGCLVIPIDISGCLWPTWLGRISVSVWNGPRWAETHKKIIRHCCDGTNTWCWLHVDHLPSVAPPSFDLLTFISSVTDIFSSFHIDALVTCHDPTGWLQYLCRVPCCPRALHGSTSVIAFGLDIFSSFQ